MVDDFESAFQLLRQGKLVYAESAFRALIAKSPQDARAFHLLGRLLHQKGQLEEAIENLQHSLKLEPGNGPALNDLGLMYEEDDQLEKAVSCFIRLTVIEPGNSMAMNNLGYMLQTQDRFAEAATTFKKAISLDPKNARAWCNLGNTLKRMDNWREAQDAYLEALNVDPNMLDVYPNLVSVMRYQGMVDEVGQVFLQWLEHDPENPIAKHMRATTQSELTPARASADYIQEVFDQFAETFEQQLQELSYQGPGLIEKAMQKYVTGPEPQFEILDAGCGTGLCGTVLKNHARRLVGVDLSSNMLDVARATGLYDELVKMDLVEFLASNRDKFDIISSADTFGYFGDLEPVLKGVRRSLKIHGAMIATFETGDGNNESAGFRLMRTGRYQHSLSYLKTVFADTGYLIQELFSDVLRMENDQPVQCVVVLAIRDSVVFE